MIYTNDHAEILKPRAGEKWQPSNGTEGMMFISRMCGGCEKNCGDDYCDTQTLTMLYSTDDEEYPSEWCIDANGQPTCTAFRAARADA